MALCHQGCNVEGIVDEFFLGLNMDGLIVRNIMWVNNDSPAKVVPRFDTCRQKNHGFVIQGETKNGSGSSDGLMQDPAPPSTPVAPSDNSVSVYAAKVIIKRKKATRRREYLSVCLTIVREIAYLCKDVLTSKRKIYVIRILQVGT